MGSQNHDGPWGHVWPRAPVFPQALKWQLMAFKGFPEHFPYPVRWHSMSTWEAGIISWNVRLGTYIYIYKQKSQLSEVGTIVSCDHSRAHQEEESLLFFLGMDSGNEKPWTVCLLKLSQLSFPPYKSFLLPLPCEALHVDGCGCRPQILKFSAWAPINPSLLEKYLAVYLFQATC